MGCLSWTFLDQLAKEARKKELYNYDAKVEHGEHDYLWSTYAQKESYYQGQADILEALAKGVREGEEEIKKWQPSGSDAQTGKQ